MATSASRLNQKDTLDHLVNAFVRERIRELRIGRSISFKQMSARVGIPLSSYACMEHGLYRLSLERVHRILRALEADIREVWPPPQDRFDTFR